MTPNPDPQPMTEPKKRSCNRHDDCDAAELEVTARIGLTNFYGFHCHDDECEECFGN